MVEQSDHICESAPVCFKLRNNIYLAGAVMDAMGSTLSCYKYCINERKWSKSDHYLPYKIECTFHRCYVATDELETIAIIIQHRFHFSGNSAKILTFSENDGFTEISNIIPSLNIQDTSFMFVRVK